MQTPRLSNGENDLGKQGQAQAEGKMLLLDLLNVRCVYDCPDPHLGVHPSERHWHSGMCFCLTLHLQRITKLNM